MPGLGEISTFQLCCRHQFKSTCFIQAVWWLPFVIDTLNDTKPKNRNNCSAASEFPHDRIHRFNGAHCWFSFSFFFVNNRADNKMLENGMSAGGVYLDTCTCGGWKSNCERDETYEREISRVHLMMVNICNTKWPIAFAIEYTELYLSIRSRINDNRLQYAGDGNYHMIAYFRIISMNVAQSDVHISLFMVFYIISPTSSPLSSLCMFIRCHQIYELQPAPFSSAASVCIHFIWSYHGNIAIK